MALSDTSRAALVGGLAALGAFFVFGGLRSLSKGGVDPLDAVPKASFLAATVDMDELRRSPVYTTLTGEGHEQVTSALGMGGLAKACGFDPLDRVEKLAVTIPEEGDNGEFGVAAHVEVSRAELERCTTALASARGGETKTREVGRFVVLEAARAGDGDRPTHRPSLAYGRGGLLVVGEGRWLEAMLAAAQNQAPRLAASPEHAALRTALTSDPRFHSPTIVVTALLPRALRDRIKGEMKTEEAAPMPNALMEGVLGVGSVGIAIEAGTSTEPVSAALQLMCDSAEACASVATLIAKKRLDWSKNLMLRMLGLGPLLDSIDVVAEDKHVRVTASMPADALASMLERAVGLRGALGPATRSAPAASYGSPEDSAPDASAPDASAPALAPEDAGP